MVYTIDHETRIAAIRADTNATIIQTLPNTGRESRTYLSHILLNWDDLVRHTLCMQTAVHQPELMAKRIKHNLNELTSVRPPKHLESYHRHDCHDP